MSNQHSVIALDWLNPVLQKVFNELKPMLANHEPTQMPEISAKLHQVTGALRLINQPELAELSQLLEATSQAISQDEIAKTHYADVSQSVVLLQYQIQQLQQSQQLHTDWIGDRVNFFKMLLGDIVTSESHFLEQITLDQTQPITPEPAEVIEPAMLSKLWRYSTLQLLEQDENQAQSLQTLQYVATYFAQHHTNTAYRKLWQITNQWLTGLLQNSRPTPHEYAALLDKLDEAIQDSDLSSLHLSNLAVDMLLQSALLENKSPQLQAILTPLHIHAMTMDDNGNMFKQVLSKLEQAIFQMATPASVLPQLQDIKRLLSNRGWQFYESHLDQIINDLQMMLDDPSNADMLSWQVERQMQDLYSQLLNTTDTLESQVGIGQFSYAQNPNQEALRQTRIHLENIKFAFNDYVQSRDIHNLSINEDLTQMAQVFGMLGLERPKVLVEQFRVLFDQLVSHQLNTISWETSDTLAEMIAQFELFLDYLSHQNVNDNLLEKTQQLLLQANELVVSQIQKPITQNELVSRDKHYAISTSVYDDSGETLVVADTPITTVQEVTNQEIAVPTATAQDNGLSDISSVAAMPVISKDDDTQDYPNTAYPDTDDSDSIIPPILNSQPSMTSTAELPESDALQQARSLLKPNEDSMDEDIREIFIEEAEEVLTDMVPNLAILQSNIDDLATLKEIRRGFHTLKGSGRMVGAFQVGETAWSVENMLNRVLDGTLSVTPEMVVFISDTHAQLPQLVAAFAAGTTPSIDPAVIVLKATNLTQQRLVAYGLHEQAVSDSTEVPLDVATPVASAPVEPAVDEDEQKEHDADKADESILPSLEAIHSTTHDPMIAVSESPASDNVNATHTPLANLPPQIQQEMDSLVWKDDDIMDEDIQEIYVEEAGEVLDEITPLYESWRTNTTDIATLKEIRRGFHTLKGSGRMVGANQLGELGWSIENMLNRILDNTIEVDTGVVALVGDVLHTFPSLVKTFAQSRDDYPEIIRLWAAIANLYSKKLGDTIDYAQLMQQTAIQHTDNISSSTKTGNIVTDSPVSSDSVALQNVDDTITSSSPVELPNDWDNHNQATIDSLASPFLSVSDSQNLSDDNVIGQVFLEEAHELLQKIDNFIANNADKDEVDIPDEMVRVFHTLRGGAALSNLPRVFSLSAALESGLDGMIRAERPLTKEKLDYLVKARQQLAEYIEDYSQQQATDAQTEDEAKHQQLLGGLFSETEEDEAVTHHAMSVSQLLELDIDELLEADINYASKIAIEDDEARANYLATLDRQAQRLEEAVSESKFAPLAQSLKNTYRMLHQYPDLAQDEALTNALIQAHTQLTNVFDTIAAGLNIHWKESVTTQLNQLVAERVYQQQLAEIEYETVINDNELVEIFLQEMVSLDDSFNASFTQWQNNLTNTQALKELQQYSYAIAGGARLVGIHSIHQLAQAVRDVYTAVLAGTLASTTELVDIMQQAYNTLFTQVQAIHQQSQSFYAKQLQQQLADIASTGHIPPDILLAVPVVVGDAANKQAEATQETVVEIADTTQNTVEYSQDIINNFEQRRIATWNGQEPDDDILQIYLEEAKELVDSSSQNLQEFRSNTNNLSALQALQRELHTIKGGARMVGAEGLATLAHEMETVYEELGSRRKPATRMIGNLLAACHDWLASALYVLENKYNPELPSALVEALLQFSKNPDSLKAIPQASLASQIDQIKIYQSSLVAKEQSDTRDISVMPAQEGNFVETQEQTNSAETIRVPANLMERMINLSGESAINRARIDMGISSLTNTIEEMGVTVQRLADQLRRMETELEVQILAQIDDDLKHDGEFDPLEMDQYSSLNQLSKSLSESASDLLDIKTTMLDKTQDAENLLLQLSRTQLELQEGLMSSRTVPFSRVTPRLQRIVRQTANELNKSVELRILNDEDEIDRNILERITSPLEHMLRNAVDHGIERTQERIESGKSRTGLITLDIEREGDEIVVYLSDDGKGINVEAVRKKAIEQGLINADDTTLKPVDIMQYIFNAGLSTSSTITQISGRGVGMDVVQSEIKQLGGVVSVDSEAGKGSRFVLRLPLTVAVSDALIVKAGDKNFAVPLVQIERVVRISAETVYQFYDSGANTIEIDGEAYRLRYLNQILYNIDPRESVRHQNASVPVIIIRNETGQKLALQVDALAGSRVEVVVKPLGRQLSHISGISAATIMGDGSVMLILDLNALMRNAIYSTTTTSKQTHVSARTTKPVVLIVDDSVTVRKVTTRLLERHGYETQVAKDGIDALEKLQELTPDIMLLDIEMPRMDGFEVATQVRHNSRLKQVPIIMITSRTGEKHRERAISIGVNEYMGKPFQEQELLDTLSHLLNRNTLTQ